MKLYFDPDVGGMSVADARANQVQATPPSIAGAVLLEALLDAERNVAEAYHREQRKELTVELSGKAL